MAEDNSKQPISKRNQIRSAKELKMQKIEALKAEIAKLSAEEEKRDTHVKIVLGGMLIALVRATKKTSLIDIPFNEALSRKIITKKRDIDDINALIRDLAEEIQS